jgi:hypothetical protein
LDIKREEDEGGTIIQHLGISEEELGQYNLDYKVKVAMRERSHTNVAAFLVWCALLCFGLFKD